MLASFFQRVLYSSGILTGMKAQQPKLMGGQRMDAAITRLTPLHELSLSSGRSIFFDPEASEALQAAFAWAEKCKMKEVTPVHVFLFLSKVRNGVVHRILSETGRKDEVTAKFMNYLTNSAGTTSSLTLMSRNLEHALAVADEIEHLEGSSDCTEQRNAPVNFGNLAVALAKDREVAALLQQFQLSYESFQRGILLKETGNSDRSVLNTHVSSNFVGRNAELTRAMEILCCKTRNSVCFAGDPGVGRKAIFDEMKKRILLGDVPHQLVGSLLLKPSEAQMTDLAGKKNSGPRPIILILPKIIFEPSYSQKVFEPPQGYLCIGVVTKMEFEEFRVEMSQFYQTVIVNELNQQQTIKIVQSLKQSYEKHHRLKIKEEAVAAAVELSTKYISDSFLPSKAIETLDDACAMVRVQLDCDQEGLPRSDQAVCAQDVAKVVARRSGIPNPQSDLKGRIGLLSLAKRLGQVLVGQDEAVTAVANAVMRARASLGRRNQPCCSMLFLGPTGVGKTECCRQVVLELFGDERLLIRLDMSEYMEEHSVSRLIGSPPGYAGFSCGGQLTNAVRSHPHSLVLIDEAEKAHPRIIDILLQVMDAGRLTDGQGRTVDFSHTLLILTSNIGARHLAPPSVLTLNMEDTTSESISDEVRTMVMAEVHTWLRPEIFNRLDDVVLFGRLSPALLRRIVPAMLDDITTPLAARGFRVAADPAALDLIIEQAYDPRYGARQIRRYLNQHVGTPLARMILACGPDGNMGSSDTLDPSFGRPVQDTYVNIRIVEGKIRLESNVQQVSLGQDVYDETLRSLSDGHSQQAMLNGMTGGCGETPSPVDQ